MAATRLNDALQHFPAVALLGPRQVGKTTLATMLAEQREADVVYLDLELPSDRARMAEPELYLGAQEGKLVILDEIHRVPGIFQTLRGIIDRRRRKGMKTGQFLVLGSASMDLLRQSAETLAGRIAYLELSPLVGAEVLASKFDGLDRLWLRGGFPDSFLASTEQASTDWRLAFIRTYLERDIPALGPRIPAETLHRFWRMLAHAQGQLFHAAPLASGLGVSGHSVARYLDVLVDLLLVRRLQPWAGNVKKRLVRSPKVYVRDSGLVHALLGIRGMDDLLGHPVVGLSWEGLVIENILALVPPATDAWFFRSSNGAEIDLILEFGSRRRHAIEVKRSVRDPRPAKGFYLACDELGIERRWVVYPGRERFPMDARTMVLPFHELSEATFQ
ncbi:MAG: ATP-binding protein [Acetobacteraceae bacterium]